MKTRKVGKLVSLILAIVLVATIMIPAVNVLADDVATKTSFDDENCIVITTAENDPQQRTPFVQLYEALHFADTDGSETFIKLDTDIVSNTPAVHDGRGESDVSYFAYEHLIVENYCDTIKRGALYYKNNDRKTDLPNEIPDSLKPYLYTINYNDSDTYYIDVDKDNIDAVIDYIGLPETKWNIQKEPKWQGRPAYDDNQLVIKEGSNVILDLAGHAINGPNNNATAYAGTPSYQSTVFVVNGSFTVIDRSADHTGTISGGTGYIVKNSEIYDNWVEEKNPGSSSGKTKCAWMYQNKFTGFNFATTGHREKSDRYMSYWQHTYWYCDATESRGGGIYVSESGVFTLNGGTITKNCAWMESDAGEKDVFKPGVDSITKGGGVYVEAGGTFNMNGGEISNNAARAYNKNTGNTKNAQAYGGGVYLEPASDGKVATMNMTAGKIAENAVYAETLGSGSGGHTKPAEADGAGIYIGEGSVCNIMGSAEASGEVTEEMMASFPQVTNNSCGAETRGSRSVAGASVTVQGAGIYCAGMLNIEKAAVTANDFSEAYNNLASSTSASAGKAVHVMRDDSETEYTLSDGTVATKPGTNTGLALYILEYNNPGPDQTPKTYITRLDPRFQDNLELATQEVTHESSGVYGTGRGSSSNKMITDGAGVCMTATGTINIGERTWIYDNYDLVTTGHKSFENSRHYNKYWVQEYTYNDPVVETDLTVTDRATAGKEITDSAGRCVYYGSYSENCNNGYCWSDTRDDVYLPDGVAMYKGSSLFECRIGVNYYNMVNDDGAVSKGAYGQAGNRVIVKSSSSLDPDIWGGSKSTPSARDIQFFYLNDNNKNYEYENYTLPNPVKPSDVWLCNPSTTTDYNNRDRVAAIDVDSFDTTKKTQSPYEGYINYNKSYDAGTWIYSTTAASTPVSKWDKYNKQTYRISDPSRDPHEDDTIQTFDNAIVNLPQRAYQLTDDMIESLPESYRRAKYMDYKVVYDNDQFGTESEPVLRFGQNVDRQMYFTVDFDEANIHYYGKSDLTGKLQSGTDLGAVNVNTLNSSEQTFVPGVDSGVYYYKGASNPQGTVTINPIVPDYNVYKDNTVLNDRIANRSVKENDGKELTSITKDANGIEDEDLFFKGWSLYVSYGYKDEDGNVVNASVKTVPQRTENDDGMLAVEGSSTINNLTALNYHNSKAAYVFDLSRIYNPNVNAQPCLSMTATWYTREELEDARARVSNVMVQNVIRSDNKVAVRAIAMIGSGYYGYDHAGFVMSTKNATPTVEGGYDFVTRANVYKKIGVTIDGQKQWYDSDVLLGKNYYDMSKNPTYKGSPIYNAQWPFTDDSHKAAFINRLETKNDGYVYAGIIYVDIIVGTYNPDAEGDTLSDKITWDENADGSLKRDTVYFVTPYAIEENATSYYYGQSRAICYADGI